MNSPLYKIARASIDIEDLARGVVGKVEVEGLDAVREAHKLFIQNGWQRHKQLEGWTKLEHLAYKRRGKKKNDYRYLKMTVGSFLGIFGIFEVTR